MAKPKKKKKKIADLRACRSAIFWKLLTFSGYINNKPKTETLGWKWLTNDVVVMLGGLSVLNVWHQPWRSVLYIYVVIYCELCCIQGVGGGPWNPVPVYKCKLPQAAIVHLRSPGVDSYCNYQQLRSAPCSIVWMCLYECVCACVRVCVCVSQCVTS